MKISGQNRIFGKISEGDIILLTFIGKGGSGDTMLTTTSPTTTSTTTSTTTGTTTSTISTTSTTATTTSSIATTTTKPISTTTNPDGHHPLSDIHLLIFNPSEIEEVKFSWYTNGQESLKETNVISNPYYNAKRTYMCSFTLHDRRYLIGGKGSEYDHSQGILTVPETHRKWAGNCLKCP